MSANSSRYYDVLEVERIASQEDIKRSYRRLALRYHPDKNKSQEAIDRFKDIIEAYNVLSDENKRYVYDSLGDDYNYDSSENVLRVRRTLILITELMISSGSELLTSCLDSCSKRARVSESYLNTNPTKGFWGTIIGGLLHRNFRLPGLVTGMLHSFLGYQVRDSLFHPSEPLTIYPAYALGGLVTYPLELINTCIRANPNLTSADVIRSIWKLGGITAFFKGLPLYSIQSILVFGGRYVLDAIPFNQWFRQKILKNDNNYLGRAVGELAIILAKLALVTLILCPLRTLTITSQISACALKGSGMKAYPSIFGFAQPTWKSLYSGFRYDFFLTCTGFIVDSITAQLLV